MLLSRVFAVIIPYPFAYIAVHIVKPVRICGKAVYRDGRFSVFAGLYLQVVLSEIIVFYFVRIVPVIVRIVRARRIFHIERRGRARAAGIFLSLIHI